LSQVGTIEQQRQLLEEPDLVSPLVASLTQLLRDELNALKQDWDLHWSQGEEKLDKDENWQHLEPEQRNQLRAQLQLLETSAPSISVEDTVAVLVTLDAHSIPSLRDRIAAMPGRFEQIAFGAAKLMEPQVQAVSLPGRTLKTEADVDAWLDESRALLLEKIRKGPVIV